jgi:hypothetical protein
MDIGQKVKIINTGDIWENKTGVLEYIDDTIGTVLVDFINDKKVRQDFNIDNIEPVEQESLKESKNETVSIVIYRGVDISQDYKTPASDVSKTAPKEGIFWTTSIDDALDYAGYDDKLPDGNLLYKAILTIKPDSYEADTIDSAMLKYIKKSDLKYEETDFDTIQKHVVELMLDNKDKVISFGYKMPSGKHDEIVIVDSSIIKNIESLSQADIDKLTKKEYSIKEDKNMAENEKVEDNKITLLAKYLKVDPSTITASNQDNTYDVEDEDAQYMILTEDEAHDYAVEDVKESFNEMGLEAFTPEFQEWILDNAIDGSYFEDAQHESNESYADDIEDESDDTFDNRLISEMYDKGILTDDDFEKDENGDIDYTTLKSGVDVESKKSEFVDKLDSEEDPVEWAKDMYSPGDLAEAVKDNDAIDVDAVAEECVSEDGVAHFIASYDDEEIDLGDGLFAYRIN